MSGIVLTCPACQTRYRATAESLGETGRTVRCARCNHTWFEPAQYTSPADVSDPVDPDLLAHVENEQNFDDTAPFTTQSEVTVPVMTEEVATDMTAEAGGVTQPAVAPEDQLVVTPPPVGADVMMRDRADQIKLARRRRTILLIWMIPLIIVILAAIIAFTQRQAIVNRIPQMATLYQAIGFEVKAGGLKMDPPIARLAEEDGLRVLRIESVVHNLTNETRPIPLIELMLHNEMGETLTQWYVETAEREIGPNSEIRFSTDYNDPPEGAVGVRYRLVEDETNA